MNWLDIGAHQQDLSEKLREWSEKRESNPRPRAWEARTLPTELFSLKEIWQGIQFKIGY